MIFAIDVGNSHIVIGMIENGKICHILRFHTDSRETATEYIIKLRQITDFYELDPMSFEGSILSSVVPSVTEPLKTAVEKLTGQRTLVVGPGIKTGVNLRVDEPGSVAADLIVGNVAVSVYYGAPAIVVDMGTATTMTVLDKNSCFRGGAILPGVKLSYRALSSNASLLPDVSILPPKKIIGSNTVDCMRSGAVYGTAAVIDGMIERIESELGYSCTVVATGALAAQVIPCCKRPDIILDKDLILRGLWALYQKNR